jgi:hypothetical protein
LHRAALRPRNRHVFLVSFDGVQQFPRFLARHLARGSLVVSRPRIVARRLLIAALRGWRLTGTARRLIRIWLPGI